MNKLRSFLVGLLLVPVLALSPGLVRAEHGRSSVEPVRSAASYCWIFYGGQWILVPC
jgi:hypothetical protein